jgi:hypothetical protein
MARKATKFENVRKADQLGAGFLANVILTSHKDAAKKLAGLVKLLEAGRSVSLGQFSIDTLLIDGYTTPWEALTAGSTSVVRKRTEGKTFETWMKGVDIACNYLCGVSIHDLPDCSFLDWYEDGDTPREAARRAIRLAKCEGDLD